MLAYAHHRLLELTSIFYRKECYEQMDGKKIIVYCDFGGQSMMAARHLRKDGFEVYNIIGGVYYYMKEKEQNKSEA